MSLCLRNHHHKSPLGLDVLIWRGEVSEWVALRRNEQLSNTVEFIEVANGWIKTQLTRSHFRVCILYLEWAKQNSVKQNDNSHLNASSFFVSLIMIRLDASPIFTLTLKPWLRHCIKSLKNTSYPSTSGTRFSIFLACASYKSPLALSGGIIRNASIPLMATTTIYGRCY